MSGPGAVTPFGVWACSPELRVVVDMLGPGERRFSSLLIHCFCCWYYRNPLAFFFFATNENKPTIQTRKKLRQFPVMFELENTFFQSIGASVNGYVASQQDCFLGTNIIIHPTKHKKNRTTAVHVLSYYSSTCTTEIRNQPSPLAAAAAGNISNYVLNGSKHLH